MKKINILLPDSGNNFDVGGLYARSLCNQIRNIGHECNIIINNNENNMREIIKKISSEEYIFSSFFTDLSISAQNYSGSKNLIDIFNSKFIFYPTDHLFTTFMWPRVRQMSRNVGVFACDPLLLDELALLRPDVTTSTIAPQTVFTDSAAKAQPPSKRDIDLLIPSTLVLRASRGRTSIDETIRAICTDNNSKLLARTLYDALLPERRRHPLEVLNAVLAAISWPPLTAFRDSRNETFWAILGILSEVDAVVRSARRLSIVSALLQDARNLRLVVTSDPPPEYSHLPGITWIGNKSLPALHELYRRSKSVLNIHPTYPNTLHERQLNSLANGAALLTDYCPSAEKFLIKGAHYLEVDETTSLAALIKNADIEAIGLSGKDHVLKEFSMKAHATAVLNFFDQI